MTATLNFQGQGRLVHFSLFLKIWVFETFVFTLATSVGYVEIMIKSKKKIYAVWNGMQSRCLRPADPSFANYGGRGITICSDWLVFEIFEAWAYDHGYMQGLQIDRIDNNKGYSPENCRFVTPAVNSCNRRMPKSNTTGFKGVFRCNKLGKFRIEVRTKLGPHLIKRGFPSAVEAAKARDAHCVAHGIPVTLNFPEDYPHRPRQVMRIFSTRLEEATIKMLKQRALNEDKSVQTLVQEIFDKDLAAKAEHDAFEEPQ